MTQPSSDAKEAEKQQFFALAEHLRVSTDEAEIRQIKEQLARMTFGVPMAKGDLDSFSVSASLQFFFDLAG